LTVRDDGIGFDVSLADEMKSVGLPGMRERMERLGGEIELSSRPGRTTLIARMPRNNAGTSA
jgi:two-component system, NarL family, sensor kinase